MSDQVTWHTFPLRPPENRAYSPTKDVSLKTSRHHKHMDYAVLHIRDKFLGSPNTARIQRYTDKALSRFGAKLITSRGPCMPTRRCKKMPSHPVHITVYDPKKIRDIIGFLFSKNRMSAATRSNIEPALKELEKSVAYAVKISDIVTQAQKDIITSFAEDFSETIIEESPDKEMARKSYCHCR